MCGVVLQHVHMSVHVALGTQLATGTLHNGCCECSGSASKLAEMDFSERGICYNLHCAIWQVLDFLVNPLPPRTAAKVPTLRAPVGSAKRAAQPAMVTSLRSSNSSKRQRSAQNPVRQQSRCLAVASLLPALGRWF